MKKQAKLMTATYRKVSSARKSFIEDTGVNDYVILVSYTPDFAKKLKTSKIDLMLSGHTHGGHITFFGLWAPYLPSQKQTDFRCLPKS
jgi:uncharacterized protein